MARKFWERVGGNRILFYDEPLEVLKDATQARIQELQEILGAPDHIKAFIAQANPAIRSEAEFEAFFQAELEELAERLDYWDMDTVQETVDVATEGWFSPADGQLGAGVILASSGEEAGNPAVNAIDGDNSTTWQHDADQVHELVVDLLYKRRIDGIRFRTGASPGNRLLSAQVQVFVANTIGGLSNNPASHVGVDLDASNPADIVDNWLPRDLATRSGRYLGIRWDATNHAQNFITVRDVEIRQHPRTFGL